MTDFVPDTIDLRKYIDTYFYGDRPHIRGRKILVSYLAKIVQAQGWSVSELADQYDISEEQALSALLYYYENKELIDTQEAVVQQEADAIRQLHVTQEQL
jgi:uncharacterized protein (DUF433 family)